MSNAQAEILLKLLAESADDEPAARALARKETNTIAKIVEVGFPVGMEASVLAGLAAAVTNRKTWTMQDFTSVLQYWSECEWDRLYHRARTAPGAFERMCSSDLRLWAANDLAKTLPKSAEATGLRACRGLNKLQYLQYLQYTEYRIQKYSTVSLPLTPSDPPTSGCIWKARP